MITYYDKGRIRNPYKSYPAGTKCNYKSNCRHDIWHFVSIIFYALAYTTYIVSEYEGSFLE